MSPLVVGVYTAIDSIGGAEGARTSGLRIANAALLFFLTN